MMVKKQYNKNIILIIIFLLTGCNLKPEYRTPDASIRSEWKVPQTPDGNISAAQLSWQKFFTVPELQNLINKGLTNNHDLKQAALNIETARAQYRITQNLLPDINITGGFSDQKIPVVNPFLGGGGIKIRQHTVNLGVTSFEIDVFGSLRNLKEAALEDYFSTAEAMQTVRIALISQIAYTYMTLLANKQQLFLSSRTLVAQQKSYDLIQRRVEVGVGTKLDLTRADTVLQTALVDYAARTRLIEQNYNALELLVGTRVSEKEITGNFNVIEKSLGKISSGLPSDLLINRPDIRQAEHLLRAANANIGAARAAFFPKLSLTANSGFGSRDLVNLFDSTSQAWLFAPQVVMPIFTWGRNQANLDVAKLRKETSIAQYEKVIQTAFREVSDALVAYEELNKEVFAQSRLVTAAKDAENLAKARYEKGVDNYLTVLDAVRSSYAAEQELINKHLAKLSNIVTLYAALGGGQIS